MHLLKVVLAIEILTGREYVSAISMAHIVHESALVNRSFFCFTLAWDHMVIDINTTSMHLAIEPLANVFLALREDLNIVSRLELVSGFILISLVYLINLIIKSV